MKPLKSSQPANANEEISALAETLLRTGRRLEELTGGDVDTLVDGDGRTLLLRGTQDQLRAGEASKQAAILNALPAHIALLDTRGVILSVNEAWRLFGRAAVVLGPGYGIGVNYLEICDAARGEDAAGAHAAAAGVRSVLGGAQRGFSLEYPCHSPAQQRWFVMQVAPLPGVPSSGAVVMHLDITGQKLAQEKQRATGQLLDNLVENIPTAVQVKSVRDGFRIQLWNKAAEVMFGLPRDAAIGRGAHELWPAADADRMHAADLELVATRSMQEFPDRLAQTRDRGAIHVHMRKVALCDAGGNVTHLLVIADDVSDRIKRNEESLRFRAAMEMSGDAIALVDRASMRYIDVNRALCDLVGRTRQEMLGMTPMELFGIDRESLERDYDAIVADNHSAPSRADGQYRHRDGSLIPIEIRRRALLTDDGWIIVGIARDITERRAAEKRIAYLNRVYAMLSAINKLIVRVRDRGELFAEACRIAVETGGFRMTWIGIVDRSAAMIVPVASAGADEELLAFIKRLFASSQGAPEGNTLAARAIRTKKILVSNDSKNDPAVLFGEKNAEFGVRSMAMLPLVVADAAVGVLVLHAVEAGFFQDEELTLLAELAGDIAFAIDHIARQAAREEADARLVRLNRVYAVLSGINALIVRVRGRDELFREACRIAVEDGKFAKAWLGVVDSGSRQFRMLAAHGGDPLFFPDLERELGRKVMAGRGLVVQALATRRPVISNDMTGDPEVVLKEYADYGGARSLAILPLVVAGEAVGVFTLNSDAPGFFDEQEMQLLVELAGNIAFGLDHIGKQERLDYAAYYDALTGLANRVLFHERLEQSLATAKEQARNAALVLLDIERFKSINDTLGRQAGDALLKELAARMSRYALEAGRLARIDADHFAIMVPDVQSEQELARLIEQRDGEVFGPSFRIGDADLRVSAKFGIAMFPGDGADADALFRNAEAALKKAKASGARYLFYAQTMNERVAEKFAMENKLRQALDKGEFVLYYQPKVNLENGKVTSAEALIRWNDPRTGLVPPGRFIPVLEETGLIHDVGRWALRQALEDYLRWRAAGLAAVRIAVNVSPLQLRDRGFIAEVKQAIGIHAQAAAGLELEITESVIMEDVKNSITSLQAIRAMGVTIAIDDFGTGFSSLAYLAKLPVDTLKIDRSFVVDMTAGPQGLALVSTIINLAHSLKLKVVAEGVETEEQSRLLQLLRCDEMQGFLFSKAVPAGIFETGFLTAASGAPA